MSTLPAPYTDVRYLASGAFGDVYAARDDAGRDLAVKVMAAARAGQPETAWQFAAEYRRLARLDHPAIPQARGEALTTDGLPCFAMDLAPGRGADQLLPLPAADVRGVLVVLAGVLAYMHGRGIVHGDLKPANVMLDLPAVMVLDVGQGGVVGAARTAIAGTPEYMAPEVFRKVPVDPAADWYALGVLGYELWSGTPPFTGSPADIVRAHLDTDPEVAGDDPELVALLQALLAKDPAHRPPGTGPLWAALGLEGLATVAAAPLAPSSFVGRQDALDAVSQVLNAPALPGAAPASWAVRGPRGTGKSRLLEVIRLDALLAGVAWVSATCSGAGEAPGAPMQQIMRQVVAAAGIPADPLLAAWLGGAVPAAIADLDPRARVLALCTAASLTLAAAARALARPGARAGLVIGLDDWHLADELTRRFYDHAQRTMTGLPIAWITAEEATLDDGLGSDNPGDLGPLADDEAMALVESRLRAPVPPSLASDMLGAAGGSPLLLELLLEDMVDGGRLRRGVDGWTYRRAAGPTASSVTAGLAAWWAGRAAKLTPGARTLAGVLAVANAAGALPVPLLGEVAGIAAADLDDASLALVAAGVAVADDGRLRLAIPALAASILAEVTDRAAMATALARRVLAGTAGDSADLGRAAWLALAGDDGALAWALAARAGKAVLAQGDVAAALRLFETGLARAMAEGAGPAERLALLGPKADAAVFADHLDVAGADHEAARDLARALGNPIAEVRALLGLATCRQMKGDYAGALALADEARAAGQGGDLFLEARAALLQARQHFYMGRAEVAIATAREAEALAARLPTPGQHGKALAYLGILLVQADPAGAEGVAMLTRARDIASSIHDRLSYGQACDNLGNAFMARGDWAAADTAFGAYRQVGQESGSQNDLLSADLNLAIVAAERGDLGRALALGQDVADRASAIGRRFPLACAYCALAQSHWRAGDPQLAGSLLDRALAIAVVIKNRYLEELVRLYRLEHVLFLGDEAAVESELAQVEALNTALGHADAATRILGLKAEAALLAGNLTEAVNLATPLRDAGNRWAVRQAHRVSALAALATGQVGAARGHAAAALQVAQGWNSAWHAQADRVLVARALRAAGLSEDAMVTAREVLADLDEGNPYARAAAAALLCTLGDATAIPVRETALARLSPARTAMGAAAAGLWRATGLSDVLPKPAASSAGMGPAGLVSADDWRRLAEVLGSTTDETAIGTGALQALLRMARAERGYLLRYEGGTLRGVIHRGIDYAAEVESGAFSHTIVERVLFTGDALYLMDASADEEWQSAQSVMALGLRTVICLPLAVPDRILGVVYLDRESIEPVLGPSDMVALEAVATMAAGAMQRERTRRQAAEAALRQADCAGLGAMLAKRMSAVHVRAALLAAMRAAAGAERAAWLQSTDGETWRVLASDGGRGAAEAFSQSIPTWVARNGEPVALLDAQAEPDWQSRASVQALGLKQVFALPVHDGDEITAVVCLDADHTGEGDPDAMLARLEVLLAYATPLIAAAGS